MANPKPTREDRALTLIESGAVQLFPGRGYALVQGKSDRYTVTRESCVCRDFELGNECKHRLATQSVCKLYRDCATEARETGKTKIPADLYLALVDCSQRAGQKRAS